MQATDASRTLDYQDITYGHQKVERKMDVRKGPWTSEEDAKLIHYITLHGEGRWNSLAGLADLKRTGKSCRLRWLNYLHPNLRRGNLTIEEQLLILDLQSRFGNRWSRIAQYLPGRTDNEIKNYWRTRVQKQARQLNCDVNSYQFRCILRCLWLPRLVEQLWAGSSRIPVQSSNYGDHNSFWTGADITAGHTRIEPTCTNYESQIQQYCSSSTHVPPAWNDFWEIHGSNKCYLEDCTVCPSERLCSPFLGRTGFVELGNQAFGRTEPAFGPPDILSTSENFWHSVDQSPDSFIVNELEGA